MLHPGDLYETARLAFMDGQVSHHNNGVLGEVFNALLTSLAFVMSDMRQIVREAISLIPADSEYRTVVDYALTQCEKYGEWEAAWEACQKKYIRYNWIHAYPNAAAEVIALWFGEGDFDKTMHISAMQGYDVDCNAAQIGTAIAIAANMAVDKKWSEPIGDELLTYMRSVKKMSIRGLAEDTVRLSEMLKR